MRVIDRKVTLGEVCRTFFDIPDNFYYFALSQTFYPFFSLLRGNEIIVVRENII